MCVLRFETTAKLTFNISNRRLPGRFDLLFINCMSPVLFSGLRYLIFLTLQDKGYHIGFSLPIPKLYSNSVLSSLNSRPRANNVLGWEDATRGSGGLSYSEDDTESHSESNRSGPGFRARAHGRGGVPVFARRNGGAGETINLQSQHTTGHTAVSTLL